MTLGPSLLDVDGRDPMPDRLVLEDGHLAGGQVHLDDLLLVAAATTAGWVLSGAMDPELKFIREAEVLQLSATCGNSNISYVILI